MQSKNAVRDMPPFSSQAFVHLSAAFPPLNLSPTLSESISEEQVMARGAFFLLRCRHKYTQ